MSAVALLLLEVTAVFAAALLGVRLASGARAAVRHLILASAFGVVLILPLATLMSPTIVLEFSALPARSADPVAATPVIVAPIAVEPRRTGTSPTARTAASITAAETIPVATWLLLIWAVVALFALVPVGASLSHLRSIRCRGQPWPEGAARMDELAHAAGMRPPVVVLHDTIAGPITSGFLRPLIALPSSAVTWSRTHVANALVHELEHVRRRDWPVHLASRTVCALYWFHPLAWIAWRALRLEAERACDDAVLAREDAASYAEQLLDLARLLARKPALSGLSMASSSDLSTRIRSVLDHMRPRGRAGKLMIACTALVAVVALAVLAPLRLTATAEKRMDRAAELLANLADADSQATAGLLNTHKHPDQSLRLVAQASLMAPERADLVWLHIGLCEAIASCDPEPLESRLRILDEKNGAGWLGALARASKRGDEEAKAAALVEIARSERMDIYWTTLVARLSPRVASTRTAPLYEAQTWVIGGLAAVAIPGLGDMSDACKRERLTQDDVVGACRGVANSLLNGDTYIIESIGASLAMRAWPENSPKWVEANEAQRIFGYRARFMGGDGDAWIRAHASDFLDLNEQHRREQDVLKAVLIEIGRNPNPAPSE
jgi:beta-lactamase regulating signal transducer with metallopeptidase domain